MSDDLLGMYKKVFSLDERMSLRDIYVLETDGQDWERFLPFLHDCPYTVEFFVNSSPLDGKPSPLPQSVEELFAILHESGWVIRIDNEHLQVHCYCFDDEGMEFDIAAADFQDETMLEDQVSRLLGFIRTIGRVLNKVIVLSEESGNLRVPLLPLFRFDPVTNEGRWFPENIELLD